MVLRSENNVDGLRHLDARLTEAGDVVIEGQDLGPGVARIFGPGLTEYEWTHTVRAKDVSLLVAALGGEPDDEVLTLIERTCSGSDAARLATLLAGGGPIPAEFWSRIGE